MKYLSTFVFASSVSRFCYRDVARNQSVNPHQRKGGKEWTSETQNQLAESLKMDLKKELGGLSAEIRKKHPVLSVKVKRGDTMGALVKGLVEKGKFSWSLPVSYLSTKLASKPKILKQTNLIYPGQVVKVRIEKGKPKVYVLDAGQHLPMAPEIKEAREAARKKQEAAKKAAQEAQAAAAAKKKVESSAVKQETSSQTVKEASPLVSESSFLSHLGMTAAVAAARTDRLNRAKGRVDDRSLEMTKRARNTETLPTHRVFNNNFVKEYARMSGTELEKVQRQLSDVAKKAGVEPGVVEDFVKRLKDLEEVYKTKGIDAFKKAVEKLFDDSEKFGDKAKVIFDESMKYSGFAGPLAFMQKPGITKALKALPVFGGLGLYWNLGRSENLAMDLGKTTLYMVPIVGSGMDFYDVYVAVKKGRLDEAALSAFGGLFGLGMDVISLASFGTLAAPAQGGKLAIRATIQGAKVAVRRMGWKGVGKWMVKETASTMGTLAKAPWTVAKWGWDKTIGRFLKKKGTAEAAEASSGAAKKGWFSKLKEKLPFTKSSHETTRRSASEAADSTTEKSWFARMKEKIPFLRSSTHTSPRSGGGAAETGEDGSSRSSAPSRARERMSRLGAKMASSRPGEWVKGKVEKRVEAKVKARDELIKELSAMEGKSDMKKFDLLVRTQDALGDIGKLSRVSSRDVRQQKTILKEAEAEIKAHFVPKESIWSGVFRRNGDERKFGQLHKTGLENRKMIKKIKEEDLSGLSKKEIEARIKEVDDRLKKQDQVLEDFGGSKFDTDATRGIGKYFENQKKVLESVKENYQRQTRILNLKAEVKKKPRFMKDKLDYYSETLTRLEKAERGGGLTKKDQKRFLEELELAHADVKKQVHRVEFERKFSGEVRDLKDMEVRLKAQVDRLKAEKGLVKDVVSASKERTKKIEKWEEVEVSGLLKKDLESQKKAVGKEMEAIEARMAGTITEPQKKVLMQQKARLEKIDSDVDARLKAQEKEFKDLKEGQVLVRGRDGKRIKVETITDKTTEGLKIKLEDGDALDYDGLVTHMVRVEK